jgi:putative ABC transport system permease protein
VRAGGADDRLAYAPLERTQVLAARHGLDKVWYSALTRPQPRKPIPDPATDPEGYERYRCAAYPANISEQMSELLAADVLPASEILAGESQVVETLDLLMVLLAALAILAAVLGLVSTCIAGVVERSREIGLLRALGAAPSHITALLLAETALVSIGGGAAGWLIGTLAASAIRGQTFGGGAAPQMMLLPVALLLALGIAVVGTLGPARLATRLDIVRVLRG